MLQGRFLLDWQASDRLKLSLNLNGFIDDGDMQAGQLLTVIPLFAPFAATIPLFTHYPRSPETPRAALHYVSELERKIVVWGKSVSSRFGHGGCRLIKNKYQTTL